MFFYIIILVFLWVISIKKPDKYIKKAKIRAFIGLTILFFLYSCRYGIGHDYSNYVVHFELVKHGTTDLHMDYGYVLFSRIVAWVSGDDQAIFIASGMVIFLLFGKTIIKKSKDPAFSVFLFFSLYFFCTSMNIMRQFIAISICFGAVRYAFEKKVVPFLVSIAIAMMFHLAAVIMIPLYLFGKVNLKIIHIIVIFSISIIILLSYDYWINLFASVFPRYEIYLSEGGGSSKCDILIMFIILFIIYIAGLNKKMDEELVFYRNMLLISLILAMFAMKNLILIRLYYYPFVFAVLAVPHALSKMSFRNKCIFRVMLMIISGGICCYYIQINSGGIIPYKVFWR